MSDLDRLAAGYRRFADLEAHGQSALYEEWARGIAGDPAMLSFLGTLPGMKKQPNLVFAAARLHGAPLAPYPRFREWLLAHWEDVLPTILRRSTQTNEAGRCAVLLPVLARLPGPLALIEVGASAGLTLYPDRYSYRYDTGGAIVALDPADGPSPVILPCAIDEGSVPSQLPEVAWRAGVDLRPVDVADQEAMSWLEALIWPEHDARRERLRAAATIAAADPPHLLEGDLLERVGDLIDAAPGGAQIVVFHSAVLVYVNPDERRVFAERMRGLSGVTWISVEGASVLPDVTAQVGDDAGSRMILSVNGRARALVGGHGQSFAALPGFGAEL